jgi:hypothetical protein
LLNLSPTGGIIAAMTTAGIEPDNAPNRAVVYSPY